MPFVELPIPPEANSDSNARELIRVWAAHGEQHVSITTGLWDDPAAWGIALADLVIHIAKAYQLGEGKDHAETLARIRVGFEAEWEHPTGEPIGGFPDV
jgi:hypothetical protein